MPHFSISAVLMGALCTRLFAAPITGVFKTDNFGYRLQDPKAAYAVQDPGPQVDLRREADDSLALALTGTAIQDRGTEAPSTHVIHGDHVWKIDFSACTSLGRYYLYSPSLDQRSYGFAIDDRAYAAALTGVAKVFFYQRCGGPKDAAYGGAWHDAACHLSDAAILPLCGTGADYGAGSYGALDLAGGWHDAGDYEKKLGNSNDCSQSASGDGGQSLWFLLTAYERAPLAFGDGSLQLPESGNGVPDLLDQARWELDWYLKMQRPDGHVLAKVVVSNLGGFSSPPSADSNPRHYGPPTRQAEEIFTACVAHAARVYATIPGQAAYAAALRTAALKTWSLWVAAAPPGDDKLWAAAEVFRLDGTQVDAKAAVDGDRAWNGSVWVNQGTVATFGMVTYLQCPAATASVAAGMRRALGTMVDYIFTQDDAYSSGMAWWLYGWNSNWNKADQGQTLLWAAELGATGAHSAADCRAHALDMLHYLHGANPLNMTYLSNAEALGAKHGAWRIFNVWFGYYSDANSKARYIGKPPAFTDPLYPYVAGADNFGVRDDDSSLSGPPPGYVPPGPTYQYSSLNGKARPPLLADGSGAPYAKAYRDWDYSDPSGTQTQPWIVNEAGLYDESSYLGLAAWFSLSSTAAALPTPSPAPAPSPGPGRLRGALPWPNPNPRHLALQLDGRADSLELALYSVSGHKILQSAFAGVGSGWSSLDFGARLAGLANGTYYFRLKAWPGPSACTGVFQWTR